MPRNVILLHICTLKEDHMIYGSRNIRSDRQKFLSFWTIFCPFSPLTKWKIKILKLKKTPGHIIILQKSNINENHMIYGSWDSELIGQNFLPFYPFNNPKNQNFEKMKNMPGDIINLHRCTIIWCMVPEISSIRELFVI